MAHNEELFQKVPGEALVLLENTGDEWIVLNSRQTVRSGDNATENLEKRVMGWELPPGKETWVMKRDWDAEALKTPIWLGDVSVNDTFEPDQVEVENTSADTTVVINDGDQGLVIDDTTDSIAGVPNSVVVSEDAWDKAVHGSAPINDLSRSAYVNPDDMVDVDNPGSYDVVLQDVGRHRGAGVKVPAGATNFPVRVAIWMAPENNSGGDLVLSMSPGGIIGPGGLVLSGSGAHEDAMAMAREEAAAMAAEEPAEEEPAGLTTAEGLEPDPEVEAMIEEIEDDAEEDGESAEEADAGVIDEDVDASDDAEVAGAAEEAVEAEEEPTEEELAGEGTEESEEAEEA